MAPCVACLPASPHAHAFSCPRRSHCGHACWLTPSSPCPSALGPHVALRCAGAEEAHALQLGPFATSSVEQPVGQGGRYLSAAHMLAEAWSW